VTLSSLGSLTFFLPDYAFKSKHPEILIRKADKKSNSEFLIERSKISYHGGAAEFRARVEVSAAGGEEIKPYCIERLPLGLHII
jgi:hypothetical protein